MRFLPESIVISFFLAAPVLAQTLSVGTVEGFAGTSATVPVSISGAAQVSAFNATIELASGEVALLSGPITAVKSSSPELAAFIFDSQYVLKSDGGAQVRIVMYPAAKPVPTFTATSPVVVAILSVPLKASATENVSILLRPKSVFDVDATTGLVGISSPTGASLVPSGGSPAVVRPNATNGSITIRLARTALDFRSAGGLPTGWSFAQTSPKAAIVAPFDWVAGTPTSTGFQMLLRDKTDRSVGGSRGRLSGAVNVPDGMILIAKWTLSGSAAAGFQSPGLSLETGLPGSGVTQSGIHLEPRPDSREPVIVPTGAAARSLTAAAWIPAGEGSIPQASLEIFSENTLSGANLPGEQGRTTTAQSASFLAVAPGRLTEPADQFFATDFSVNWELTPNANRGIEAAASILPDGSGIFLEPTGTFVDFETSAVARARYSIWEGIGTFAANRIYRLDVTLSSTANKPDQTVTTRASLIATDGEWRGELRLETPDGVAPIAIFPARSTHTAYFLPPAELAGTPMAFEFEAGRFSNEDSGGVRMTGMTIRSWKAPL